MESQNTTQQSLFNNKPTLRQIGIGVGVTIIVLFVIFFLPGVSAKTPYQAKVPQLQSQYETTRTTTTAAIREYCKSWKELNKGKIEDESNGAGKEPPRMDEWNSNLKFDCKTVKASTGF